MQPLLLSLLMVLRICICKKRLTNTAVGSKLAPGKLKVIFLLALPLDTLPLWGSWESATDLWPAGKDDHRSEASLGILWALHLDKQFLQSEIPHAEQHPVPTSFCPWSELSLVYSKAGKELYYLFLGMGGF